MPAPEILGYDAGKEVDGQRFMFIPYTQALQPTLRNEAVDLDLNTPFPDEEVRGKVNNLGLVLKWSLINNPLSSLSGVADTVSEVWNTIFPEKNEVTRLAWEENDDGQATKLAGQVTLADKKVTDTFEAEINPNLNSDTNKKTDKAAAVAENTIEDDTKIETKTETKAETKHPTAIPAASGDIFSLARPTVATTTVTASTAKTKSKTKETAAAASTVSKNVALWSPIAAKSGVSTDSSTKTTTKKKELDDEEEEEEAPEPVYDLVISRIHTQGDDDWIEIWNYGEEDIDLAASKIRLEKAKTALNPGIMIRFDNTADASFPGGTVIRAGSAYRIVRDDAAAELRNAAHAIALRSDFSLTDSGFTIYLAKDAVSRPDDEDIIDYVGYGEAKYYEGSGPAPALTEGYLLRRKADAATTLTEILKGGTKEDWAPKYDNDNSRSDWLLWPLGGVIISEEEDKEDDDNNNEDDDSNSDDNTDDDNEDDETDDTTTENGYTMLPGVDSPGQWRLWSFDECAGTETTEMIGKNKAAAMTVEGTWAIGRWGCGQKLPYGQNSLKAALNPLLSGVNFSLAFQFKGNGDYSNPYIRLDNTKEETSLRIDLFSTMTEFNGFPGLSGRYASANYMDNEWHQAVLVWNSTDGYWGLYFDGDEIFYQTFSGDAAGFDLLTMGAVAGENYFDDVALWNRTLTVAEIQELAAAANPFNPQTVRETPAELQLLHAWNFNEASGHIAGDSVGGLDWNLPEDALVYDGLSGKGLDYPKGDNPYNLTIPALGKNNFSISWWWQNNAVLPYSGRLHIDINDNETKLAGIALDNWRQIISSINNDDIWVEGKNILPQDNLWHHLALVYNDYIYRWQLFIDGKLEVEERRLPLPSGSIINNLKFSSTVWGHKIDNFKIWQGTLDAAKVLSEYNNEKPD